jgi:hypothetical protein
MKEYNCPRCGYYATQKSNFVAHLNRKSKCDPILSDVDPKLALAVLAPTKEKGVHKCPKCEREFATRNGKYKHVRACTVVNEELVASEQLCEDLKEFNEFKKFVKFKQSTQATALVHSPSLQVTANSNNNVQITNSNNTNIQQNITIMEFGKENLSHLTPEQLRDCLYRCQHDATLPDDNIKGIAKLFQHITALPENRTVRLSKRQPAMLDTRCGTDWIADDKNRVLGRMVQQGYKIMTSFKNEAGDLESEDRFEGIMDDIEEYLSDIRFQKQDVFGPLKRDLYIMLVNNDRLSEVILLEK